MRSLLDEIPGAELNPILNLGSSTLAFRVHEQPHIDSMLFEPLRQRKVETFHQDIKPAIGVDLVGDLMDPLFIDELRELGCRTVLCNNLLQHVESPEMVLGRVSDLLAAGALLIVTGPAHYQKHYDPIDNLFRPDPEQVTRMMGKVDVVSTATLDVGTVVSSFSGEGVGLLRFVGRLAIPFGNTAGWLTAARKVTWLFRHRLLYCVAVRKITP